MITEKRYIIQHNETYLFFGGWEQTGTHNSPAYARCWYYRRPLLLDSEEHQNESTGLIADKIPFTTHELTINVMFPNVPF